MKGEMPSLTARRAAWYRAIHQTLDHPRVFEDPLAVPLLGRDALDAGDAASSSTLSSYVRAFVAARSRYAEETLASAVQDGLQQYVILGAGLDTFAYRNPFIAHGLRVFEVDHPHTQRWKRKRLEEAGIAAPTGLAFVPLDLERTTIEEALREAGWDRRCRSLFSWLGVTPYLSEGAVETTLRFIASTASGSIVVFDYMVSPAGLTSEGLRRFHALARRVAEMGEPWRCAFDPPRLAAMLAEMGFTEVEDLDGEAINARYFAGRSDGLRVGSLSRLVKATVAKGHGAC